MFMIGLVGNFLIQFLTVDSETFYRLFTIGLVGNVKISTTTDCPNVVLPIIYDRISWKHGTRIDVIGFYEVLPIVYDRISWKHYCAVVQNHTFFVLPIVYDRISWKRLRRVNSAKSNIAFYRLFTIGLVGNELGISLFVPLHKFYRLFTIGLVGNLILSSSENR